MSWTEAVIVEEASAVQTHTTEAAYSLLDRIKSILGEHYRPRPEVSIEQDREALLNALPQAIAAQAKLTVKDHYTLSKNA